MCLSFFLLMILDDFKNSANTANSILQQWIPVYHESFMLTFIHELISVFFVACILMLILSILTRMSYPQRRLRSIRHPKEKHETATLYKNLPLEFTSAFESFKGWETPKARLLGIRAFLETNQQFPPINVFNFLKKSTDSLSTNYIADCVYAIAIANECSMWKFSIDDIDPSWLLEQCLLFKKFGNPLNCAIFLSLLHFATKKQDEDVRNQVLWEMKVNGIRKQMYVLKTLAECCENENEYYEVSRDFVFTALDYFGISTISRPLLIFTGYLKMCGRRKDWHGAESILQKMKKLLIAPDTV